MIDKLNLKLIVGASIDHADSCPVCSYLAADLSTERSRSTQADRLRRIAEVASGQDVEPCAFAWWTLTYSAAVRIRRSLSERLSEKTDEVLSPAYVNAHLCALRSVVRQSWRLGLMSEEQRARVCDIQSLPMFDVRHGRIVSLEDRDRLFACLETNLHLKRSVRNKAIRDLALLSLAFFCGVRRGEMIRMDLSDYRESAREIHSRHGFYGKSREVHLPDIAEVHLARWIELRGREPGPLLCPVRKGGTVELRRMTDHAVFLACKRRALQTGIDRFSPHDAVRTYAADLYDANVDVGLIQELLGHRSITTTKKLDRRPRAVATKAADDVFSGKRGVPRDGE